MIQPSLCLRYGSYMEFDHWWNYGLVGWHVHEKQLQHFGQCYPCLVGGVVGGLVFDLIGLGATNAIGYIIRATVGAILVITIARKLKK